MKDLVSYIILSACINIACGTAFADDYFENDKAREAFIEKVLLHEKQKSENDPVYQLNTVSEKLSQLLDLKNYNELLLIFPEEIRNQMTSRDIQELFVDAESFCVESVAHFYGDDTFHRVSVQIIVEHTDRQIEGLRTNTYMVVWLWEPPTDNDRGKWKIINNPFEGSIGDVLEKSFGNNISLPLHKLLKKNGSSEQGKEKPYKSTNSTDAKPMPKKDD